MFEGIWCWAFSHDWMGVPIRAVRAESHNFMAMDTCHRCGVKKLKTFQVTIQPDSDGNIRAGSMKIEEVDE